MLTVEEVQLLAEISRLRSEGRPNADAAGYLAALKRFEDATQKRFEGFRQAESRREGEA